MSSNLMYVTIYVGFERFRERRRRERMIEKYYLKKK